MEMEVMIPSPALDFNFDSACTSPYMTAPSSPQRLGGNVFFSAPTSPTSAASFLRDFNSFSGSRGDDRSSGVSLPSTIPFNWEEKPGIPKAKDTINGGENDFEFDFSGQLERTSLSAADELFDGGKIKPLKPPPRLQQQFTENGINNDSPNKSPRSPITSKKFFKEALSPRRKKKKDVDPDPFAAAMEQTCQGSNFRDNRERGRERMQRQKQKGVARSLSPFRVFDIFGSERNQESSTTKTQTSSLFSFSNSGWKLGYKKWSLKDLLLFRSASEGRATSKLEPLKNYSLLKKKKKSEGEEEEEEEEDVKNWSFRSTESSGSVSRRRVSAHELHYTANRAVSEEMRKKTFLPYKRDLLGCLGFNPGVHDVLGSLPRG